MIAEYFNADRVSYTKAHLNVSKGEGERKALLLWSKCMPSER
jgi:hypothetical protein